MGTVRSRGRKKLYTKKVVKIEEKNYKLNISSHGLAATCF